MKAPSGTKPGDKVRVDIPDGAIASKKTVQDKLVIFVIGANGNIHITILPEVFKRLTVVVIIVERISFVAITGGTGGN
jgi:protein involved in polysaccharide export with SLBB domain